MHSVRYCTLVERHHGLNLQHGIIMVTTHLSQMNYCFLGLLAQIAPGNTGTLTFLRSLKKGQHSNHRATRADMLIRCMPDVADGNNT